MHGIALSNTLDRVYVGDRDNDRFQVFTTNGTFVYEMRAQSVWDFSFSSDEREAYVYVTSGMDRLVRIYDQTTHEEVGSFGGHGDAPGLFHSAAHSVATDSKGNLFVTEIGGGRMPCKVQKFVRQ